MQADLSIVLSCYNNKNTILQALNSVLKNTWGGYNFELIIVNDGSTDGTDYILEEFSNYSNVTVLNKEKNEGTLLSRIDGAQIASGKFITFMDADDLYIDGIDERLKEAFDKDADIIEFYFNYCYSDGRKEFCEKILPVEEYINPQQQVEKIIKCELPVGLWHRYYKNQLIKNTIEKFETENFRKEMNGNIHDDHFLSPIIFYEAKRYIISKQFNYDYTIYSETSVQKKLISLRQKRQDILRYKYYLSIMYQDEKIRAFIKHQYHSAIKLYLLSDLKRRFRGNGVTD